MAIGLRTSVKVDDIKKLKEYVEYVKKFSTIKSDKNFQKFLQEKFLETVNSVATANLPSGELTQLYISNNKIEEISSGFILYNDTYVEIETEGYGGKFSIALAFEYGTGLVGQENPKVGAWQYNVNQHEKGWNYFQDGQFYFTRGMQGYEIYRYTLEEIKKNLKKWVQEYEPKKDGGVSL